MQLPVAAAFFLRSRLIAGALAVLLVASAQAQPSRPVAQQLATLHAMVFDPARTFSVSQTLAELDGIEARTAPDTTERGEVAFLRGFIEQKADRPCRSIPPSIEALRIDDAHPFLSPRDRLMTNYRVATQAQGQDDCPTAIPYFRRLVAMAPDAPGVSESQRLSLRGDLGFCLHETGEYAAALALNQALLADGERLFGPSDRRLLTTLINIVQNNYALHDPAAARASLQRVLAIATAVHDADHVDTALFQLGVLADEDGQPDEARRLMQERLRLAEQDGDRDRIADAKRDLNALEHKLGR